MNYTEQIFELSAPFDNVYQGKALRVLFVCSAGLLRSATAAALATSYGINSRAAGSHDYALIPVSVNLIMWAHKIVFVNIENYEAVKRTFKFDPECVSMLEDKSYVWSIPDQYEYMHPSLVHSILEKMPSLLEKPCSK